MIVEFLLSCMNQENLKIVFDSNLQNSNVLIVNQCQKRKNEIEQKDTYRVICSNESGLSKSRNMAILNAIGDVCVLTDDDELFIDGAAEIINKSYERYPNADLIIFQVAAWPYRFGKKKKLLSRLDLRRVSSVQITFKRESLMRNNIRFDENLGAGTFLGSGEESKFLIDCKKAGLNIIYLPIELLSLRESKSSWFTGFNKDYLYKRGAIFRYVYGLFGGLAYSLYFLMFKWNKYHRNVNLVDATTSMAKGFFESKSIISASKGSNSNFT